MVSQEIMFAKHLINYMKRHSFATMLDTNRTHDVSFISWPCLPVIISG